MLIRGSMIEGKAKTAGSLVGLRSAASDLVGGLANDALGVDRDPAAAIVGEDVVVVQVAVQQPARTLRAGEIAET